MTYTSVNQALIASTLQVKSATHLLIAQNADDHETRILAAAASIADGTTGNTALGARATALEGRATALEAAAGGGWWKAADSTQNVPYGSSPTAPTLLFGTVVKTAIGCTYSSGVVTVSSGNGGWWNLSAQFDLNVSASTTHSLSLQITNSAQTVTYGSGPAYYPTSAFTSLSASATSIWLNAADTFKAILYVYTGTGSGNYTNSGPGVDRTHLRAVRIGI